MRERLRERERGRVKSERNRRREIEREREWERKSSSHLFPLLFSSFFLSDKQSTNLTDTASRHISVSKNDAKHGIMMIEPHLFFL